MSSMRNEKTLRSDYLIVGGGIIGLTTAFSILEKFPEVSLTLLEAEKTVASPVSQSASNSNVVHAGVYYKPGSLKAEYCKQGNKWIEKFCEENNLPFERCGKLIVATDDAEVERLDVLYSNALANGLDLEVLDEEEIRKREPNIVGKKAVLVKDSAITDYPSICRKLSEKIQEMGGEIFTESEVVSIDSFIDSVSVRTKNGMTFSTGKVIVCAGIQSDRIAEIAGFETDFRMIPFRGEYYVLPDSMGDITHSLIYPVPDPDVPFLGVHLTKTVDGRQTVGPNAVVGFDRKNKRKLSVNMRDAWDIASFSGSWKLAGGFLKTAIKEQWDSLFKTSYIKRVKKYSPSVEMSDLKPYPCGIRAQAVRKNGSMIEDFDIRKNQDGNIVLCVNVPSPAATSSYPISQYILSKLEKIS